MQVKSNLFLIVLKQFGTGVIISTAFAHVRTSSFIPFIHIKLTLQQLYTHATLMFGNSCLTGLEYEATTSAIVMAGLFISFLIEVFVSRALRSNQEKKAEGGQLDASPADIAKAETGNVAIMEAGIIFHSIRMLSCNYLPSRRRLY